MFREHLVNAASSFCPTNQENYIVDRTIEPSLADLKTNSTIFLKLSILFESYESASAVNE